MKQTCPFCALNHDIEDSEIVYFNCFGSFFLNFTACKTKIQQLNSTGTQKEKISWAILRYYIANNILFLIKKKEDAVLLDFEGILKNYILPTPNEQTENILLLVGDNTYSIGEKYEIYKSPPLLTFEVNKELVKEEGNRLNSFVAMCGGLSSTGIDKIIKQLREDGLLEYDMPHTLSLTLKGWQKYSELKRIRKDSTSAFMAMQFNNRELTDFYNTYIKKAVSETGFEIRRIDEKQRAGLIDAHLRLEISRSRFVLADLTDENNGAYWEAGYAEGLGRPVIYIYDERKHNKEKTEYQKENEDTCIKCGHKIKNAPHFDTNHHLTIFWNPEKPQEFVDKLKETIRFTIPDSKQED